MCNMFAAASGFKRFKAPAADQLEKVTFPAPPAIMKVALFLPRDPISPVFH
jgi:hypothetical protein